MSHTIHLIRTRNALKPRREPYWGAPLDAGRYLGVRKLNNGACTWVARLRDDDGRHKYRSLGQATQKFDYSQAKQAAEAWFEQFDTGVDDKPITVTDACRLYVADLKADNRVDTAHDVDTRFRRTVYSAPIGRVLVEKLTTDRIKEWRNELGVSESTQNRMLTSLRAALNLAVAHRRVRPSAAQSWKAAKAHKDADGQRTIYLDLKQRRRLLSCCEGTFRDLAEAAALTGARPGELKNVKRSDFEPRTGTITFRGRKSGARQVPLSPPALTLFTRLSKGKLPEAYLLTRPDGKQWQRYYWDDYMRAAARQAKLPTGTVLYTLRHSFITEAVTSGMSTLDVANLTGTSLKMIEKFYGHLVVDSARERLAKVTML